MILAVSEAPDYAFPHSAEDESRRLELLEQRLDPLTKQRIQRLGVGKSARCLEIGGGRGSITRWLSHVVGPTGRVIATDVQIGFLSEIDASNVEVIRHDIRTGTFPPGSFDLIHTRAVLMHISPSVDLLRRIVTWLAPGGWLVLEEPDFGMWIGDADPAWATSPQSTQVAFGRSRRRLVMLSFISTTRRRGLAERGGQPAELGDTAGYHPNRAIAAQPARKAALA